MRPTTAGPMTDAAAILFRNWQQRTRIDALPASEKSLLQTLAVIGKDFPLNLVKHITASPDDRLEPMLKSLQAGEFIYASQNAKVWLTLRPAVGSTVTRPPVISANDLLGLTPIRVGG